MFKVVVTLGVIVSVVIFTGFYIVVRTDAQRGIVPQAPSLNPLVEVISRSQDGYYRFSGEVKLPHSCYRLHSSVTADASDPSVIRIILTSEDNSGNLSTCARYPTPYPFDILQSSGTPLRPELFLDGAKIPVRVIEKPWGVRDVTL